MLLPGFEIIQLLYQNENTIVYRCTKLNDASKVIVKTSSEQFRPNVKDLFQHEFDICQELNLPTIVKPLSIEHWNDRVYLIMEDHDSISLKSYIYEYELSMKDIYNISIQLVDILSYIHEKQIIHKDIKTENIIIHPETKEVKLIDFQIASRINIVTQSIVHPNSLEGSLQYMSPEQTGRMNREIDYRTDYYSLGVTIFEMLTKQLPFKADDAMEWVHSHIAKEPRTPSSLEDKIPLSFSNIIMKLLEKMAENRYQSSYGLKADIEKSLKLYQEGRNETFLLGSLDTPSSFQVQQKLYGREQELQLLIDNFEKVCREETTNLILISGYSGIGKTSLVKELYRNIFDRQGFFIQGKFEQFNRDIPYSALTQAFGNLIKYLLTEGNERISHWKRVIEDELGANTSVIADMIPELCLLIGEQPETEKLSPAQTEYRFKVTFEKFIQLFATKQHPLVLFIDDLQWADSATLFLIEHLLKSTENRTILIIGAYRDNEIENNHIFHSVIKTLRSQYATNLKEIKIYPLLSDHITTLIQESLYCSIEDAVPLAGLVHKKTAGNPFFIQQLLKKLVQSNLIFYNRNNGSWQWDYDNLQTINITDNVIELMLEKLKEMSNQAQEIVHIGSCIGSTFNLQHVANLLEKDFEYCLETLKGVLAEGLLVLNDSNNLKQIRFVHDRVHQAAYQLFSNDVKNNHYKIGKYFLNMLTKDEISQQIFTVVGHFNQSIDLLQKEERSKVAELNLEAAIRAKGSTAYKAAVNLLDIATTLFEQHSWEKDDKLIFNCYFELANCHYLNGNSAKAEELFDMLTQKALTKEEKLQITMSKMMIYSHLARFEEAKQMGIETLKTLGMKLSNKVTPVHLGLQVAKMLMNTYGKSKRDFLALPDITDKNLLEILKVGQSVVVASYYCDQNYSVYLGLKLLSTTIKKGNSPHAASTYGIYATLLCFAGMPKRALEIMETSIEVSEKYENSTNKTMIHAMAGGAVYPWVFHFDKSVEYLHKGIYQAIDSGDLLFGTYLACDYLGMKLFSGYSLNEILEIHDKYLSFVTNANEENVKMTYDMIHRYYQRLTDNPSRTSVLSEDDEAKFFDQININDIHMYYFALKIQLSFLYENHKAGTEMGNKAQSMLKYLSIPFPEVVFYHTLNLTAIYNSGSNEEKKVWWKQINKNKKKLEKWTKNNPSNFKHKLLLTLAEMARLQEKHSLAIQLYDEAIKEAQTQNFQQCVAISNELAGNYFLDNGNNQVAKFYFLEAYQVYMKWGATEKAKMLQEQFNFMNTASHIHDSIEKLAATIIPTSISSVNRTTVASHSLDFMTVMKSAETLSKEIVFTNLLDKLMNILLENAGAQKGAIILQDNEESIVEGRIDITTKAATIEAIPLQEIDDMAKSIIHYVIKTEQPVVVIDATTEEMFRSDEYIRNVQPKSILCVPIINQGVLLGSIYLENNLSIGAFTENRVELLKVLSSQIAISIENAKLYRNLEKSREEIAEWNVTLEHRVKERTEELQNALKELQQAQNQLIQSEKMAALGNLVAGVAHELNTPLGISITTVSHSSLKTAEFSEKMQENKVKKSDLEKFIAVISETNELIMKNLKRSSQLVQSFKQIAVDQELEEKRIFNLKDYLEELLSTLSAVVQKENHEITLSCENNISTIHSSPGAISKILSQLVLNSLKHAFSNNQKGQISIKVSKLDNNIRLAFSDNGKGISEEHKAKIFEPFFTTNRIDGTGLGLHIIFNTVTQTLNGTIQCESELGKGTTFIIEFKD